MARQTLDPTRFSADVVVHTDILESLKLPVKRRRPRWLIPLLALDVAVLALGAYLLFASAAVAPPAERRIVVPFADNEAVLASFRAWVVQDDGRLKPFDTFARESVRTVTGRERFEGNDPVAVTLAWLLGDAHAKAGDWEDYPFLLCDYPELRTLLYRDWYGDDRALTDQESRGKYVSPAVLRKSLRAAEPGVHAAGVGARLLLDLAVRQHADAKAPMTALEDKLMQLKKRLDLFDAIRGGGVFDQELYERARGGDFFPPQPHPADFGVVALDEQHPQWFSLDSVRAHVRQPVYWLVTQKLREGEGTTARAAQPFPAGDARQVLAAFTRLRDAYRGGDEAAFATASTTFLDTLAEINERHQPQQVATTASLELWFNAVNPFRKAWLFSLLAGVLLAGSLLAAGLRPAYGRITYGSGLLAYAVALGWAATGFYCRVAISDRPPVSNMYESIIWVGFMTAAFGLLLEAFSRRGYLAVAGALVSTLVLVLADQLPLTFNPAIQPLQAVLRSQYWLVVHVLTIVSSYAAFALAWGLGNLNLGLMLWAPGETSRIQALSRCCYRAVQLGVVLLAAGTLLGGFWAAESWGRFWGWDPKEVWALIALVCYLIPLHARYVGWVKDIGLSICAVVCFASVVMAWYGVNYVLGAGLHSYGFGGGGQAWIYFAGLANICLVLHALSRGAGAASFVERGA
jgi:ABC-type transport system involved in cytochrome c biogenesis permease subunit